MAFGDQELKRGDKGADVVELQLRLAGFRGTFWDGDFGPGTELQVMAFQRDYMKRETPNSTVDAEVYAAIRQLADDYPVDFEQLRCPCSECQGFGQGRHQGEYLEGKAQIEAYYKREYPGVHKAILHTYRAVCFHLVDEGYAVPTLTSGYRCWDNNRQHNRTSTNHMGKALDIDFVDGAPKRDDAKRCERARGILVERCGFQIGWGAGNLKSLEPANIAPTWIHMDVRSFNPRYLADECFVQSETALDAV